MGSILASTRDRARLLCPLATAGCWMLVTNFAGGRGHRILPDRHTGFRNGTLDRLALSEPPTG